MVRLCLTGWENAVQLRDGLGRTRAVREKRDMELDTQLNLATKSYHDVTTASQAALGSTAAETDCKSTLLHSRHVSRLDDLLLRLRHTKAELSSIESGHSRIESAARKQVAQAQSDWESASLELSEDSAVINANLEVVEKELAGVRSHVDVLGTYFRKVGHSDKLFSQRDIRAAHQSKSW